MNRTFTMIKPDAVENGHTGAILEKINSAGFRIVGLKKTQLTVADAQAFYEVHKERPFFDELVSFMTRGPIVCLLYTSPSPRDLSTSRMPSSA